jgi:exodeoxyribonuclease V alpha subunit
MMAQPQSATEEVLAGYVERVTYHNAENGFCVLRAKARGHRDVVVGHAAAIAVGEWITVNVPYPYTRVAWWPQPE